MLEKEKIEDCPGWPGPLGPCLHPFAEAYVILREAASYIGRFLALRRRGREAEGGGLLNRYRVVKPYRGFESLRLRQLSKLTHCFY